ncbi:MAG TPA: hypothetical protein EYP25_08225, partial [Anaerolineae bacterium]|nr:hypothetical protein [Anaerolineae bacterium]
SDIARGLAILALLTVHTADRIYIFFNTNFVTLPLIALLFLGTLGFAAVGAIFSGLAVNTRTREILLPVLLFPVMLPVLMAGIRATIGFMEGDSLADMMKWFNLIIFFDILYIVVAYLTFDYVVEE